MDEYRRPQGAVLAGRLGESRRFMQVLAGPRQVGKTTLVRQVLAGLDAPSHYASADAPVVEDRTWIELQWDQGRRAAAGSGGAVLVLDEVQKIADWAPIAKRLWDADTVAGIPLHVVLLGSAPLLVQRGLTESLAGRFEIIRLPHWSLAEMRATFRWSVEEYVLYGGYPGAAPLLPDEPRWRAYVLDSLIETSIARDVLLLSRIAKPALLRQLFAMACAHSGQVVSYTKLLGQLQDAGNTTTLAHYLELLGGAGLVTGLSKHAGGQVRRRGSSPKLLALNTALVTAIDGRSGAGLRADGPTWGRLVETAVGAHLVNGLTDPGHQVRWWLDGNDEVDYVLAGAGRVVAIEVQAGAGRRRTAGLETFRRRFDPDLVLVVGADGIDLEEFLMRDPRSWLDR